MEKYHNRRPERAIEDLKEIEDIIRGQRYMTLAFSKDNTPYLATLTYVFDFNEYCFYFHCANAGKKKDYLEANPQVYGQILEDGGYLNGECLHAFRTVQFSGTCKFITDIESKRRALNMLIEKHESNPDESKRRFIDQSKLEKTAIVKLEVLSFSGKQIKPKK